MTVKMQKFTKGTRAISRNEKGFYNLTEMFHIEDVAFQGRLFAALGAGHAITGELFSDIPYDHKIIDSLSGLVGHDSEVIVVIYRSSPDRYQAVLFMRIHGGRLHELARTIATNPSDALSKLERIMSHPDYLEAVVKPVVTMIENQRRPSTKRLTIPVRITLVFAISAVATLAIALALIA